MSRCRLRTLLDPILHAPFQSNESQVNRLFNPAECDDSSEAMSHCTATEYDVNLDLMDIRGRERGRPRIGAADVCLSLRCCMMSVCLECAVRVVASPVGALPSNGCHT